MTDMVKERLASFDKLALQKCGEGLKDMEIPMGNTPVLQMDEDIPFEDIQMHHEPIEPAQAMPSSDDTSTDEETFNKYLRAEILLPIDNDLKRATIIGRKRDSEGKIVGVANDNPYMDTQTYLCQFEKGHVEEYTNGPILPIWEKNIPIGKYSLPIWI